MANPDWQDPGAVRFMLDDCETWAVVGLTDNPARTAYSIAALLQERGKRVVPINPDGAEVLEFVQRIRTGVLMFYDIDTPITLARLEAGEPCAVILSMAKTMEADLVVLSTRGRNSLRDAVLGTHAQRVIRHAPCPVLLS